MDDMSTPRDDHDDGLVHGHAWAAEPPPSARFAATARPAGAAASLAAMGRVIPAREEDHDDGLVHDHGWACRERGAEAHA